VLDAIPTGDSDESTSKKTFEKEKKKDRVSKKNISRPMAIKSLPELDGAEACRTTNNWSHQDATIRYLENSS
jgi:hypothetical protein